MASAAHPDTPQTVPSAQTTVSAAAAPQREQWTGQLGFLMAAIGSAIGLGNIWRFPGVAYTNGGGAFMIPYICALLLAGIPFLFLDYALGHRMRGSAPAVFRRVAHKLEWLGWLQVIICFVIMTYYAVVVAWSLRYTIFSVNEAWGDDASGFFARFIGRSDVVDGTPAFSATPVAGVIIPLAVVWVLSLVIIARGVSNGVEKANRIFLPLLVLMFAALVIRALFLPGASGGLDALFTPDWGALRDARVWMAAFSQIFFSLSIGFGIMLTYASYLRPRSNLVGTGLVAAFANSSFELLAGIGVFATLGYMAGVEGVSVADLDGIQGVSLSFITFPTVVSQMPGGPLFGVLFFASFFMAGLTSLISIIQVVAAGFSEKFAWSTPKATLIAGIPAAAISLILFGTPSGMFNLDVVDAYINNIGVVASAIISCIAVGLVLRRLTVLRRHLNAVSETTFVGSWWVVMVGAVIPVLLGVMFVQNTISYARDGYDSAYAKGFEGVFGWGMLLLVAVAVALFTRIPWRSKVDDFAPLDLDSPDLREHVLASDAAEQREEVK